MKIVSALMAIVIPAITTSTLRADDPPAVPREFRAAWIATVANIDWPSKPGLSTARQQGELIALLDKAVELNLNAVILQVRPSADALYASKLEPWSEYLTGHMGQAPEPFYDPLEFAVGEAHKRGLQLHVWFNPYRVRPPSAKTPASPDHASIAHPELVRTYGGYQWFDPGEPAAIDHFIEVLTDIVSRYDVDGVHIDDYFYPYPVEGKDGKTVPFPDEESYARAVAAGETLERDDWRRQNVNHLIERMYTAVKKTKPWVLVGISPFGIWRPQNPPGITGFDQYATLYADARKWEQEGWLDYLTPQLYWTIDSRGQSYPKLLAWWQDQNTKKRHLWPGNATFRVEHTGDDGDSKKAWPADELVHQIEATRAQPGAGGNVHFSMKALQQNYGGVSDLLKKSVYAEPAIVPETVWLGDEMPPQPALTAQGVIEGVSLEMKLPSDEPPWLWVVRTRTGERWKTEIVPGQNERYVVSVAPGDKPSEVTVSAVTRLGREGPIARAVIEAHD